MTKRRSRKVFRSRKQSAAAGYVTIVVLVLLLVAAVCIVTTMSPPKAAPSSQSSTTTARPDVRNTPTLTPRLTLHATRTPRPASIVIPTRVPVQSQVCPRNCEAAVAAGMSAQAAGQCPNLDRDGDGVACYGD